MKAWKKISALVLALGLTAGFAACGGNDGGSSSSAPAGEPEEVKTLDACKNLWKTLFAETNVTIVYTEVTEVEESGESVVMNIAGTAQFQNGKWYMEETRTQAGETTDVKCYYGKVNGVSYGWASTDDGETWESKSFPEEDVSTVKYMFSNFEEDYLTGGNGVHFNENTGMNSVSEWNKPTLEYKVVGGKIVEYRVVDEEKNDAVLESGTITYGTATVGELPSLDR